MAYDEQLAERVRALIHGHKGLTEKLMFGGIAFLVDGHMAVGVARDRLMVRFDPARHDEIVLRKGAGPMDFTKRSGGMRGMAFVSQDALGSESALAEWIELALGFVTRLPRKTEGRTTAGAKTKPMARPVATGKAPAKAPAAKAKAPAAKAKPPAAKAKKRAT